MNFYRTNFCSDLSISNLNTEVTLSGWIDTVRDHGNLIFIDLRDNYGITQCVVDAKHKIFDEISKLTNESVITIKGKVIKRCDEIQDWFEKLPEEMEVFNTDDDYLTFRVEAKDKDDVKYYKRKGFN